MALPLRRRLEEAANCVIVRVTEREPVEALLETKNVRLEEHNVELKFRLPCSSAAWQCSRLRRHIVPLRSFFLPYANLLFRLPSSRKSGRTIRSCGQKEGCSLD